MSQREQWHFDGNSDEPYERFLVPTKFGSPPMPLVSAGYTSAGKKA